MPLTYVKTGQDISIKKILGKDETKRFLASLGFVLGESVTVVSQMGENLIVNVKGSRVAIGKDLANRILV